ncbi:hypothetical protein EN925_10325 [Mesorhizobium sp. M7A.F.Ca.US.006.04.2.1]|uniref:hypothetical protein n=1 Tax=unclassified Mesorhizobium TaxID=325217 RepID=UPI000FCB7C40|nr:MULTISPECIES: hypothetical protein [unclassified Mesorhizobium]RUX70678.1 hypothetical protein EN990_30945 [Mesorhizobium sp. M7A.F.Ca.US.005.03.1.1]RUY09074.1 hypothetical protein EN991_30055 [Mesorhizobium sp. M7A.F.Ca.US.005.03.2.1]RVA92586.1 hypothetical protein EN925_10325 [Mesorhizobium sp. M7A.F.Ca.US.006.04.2.1]
MKSYSREFALSDNSDGSSHRLLVFGEFPNAEGFVGCLTTAKGAEVLILGLNATGGRPAKFRDYLERADARFRRFKKKQATKA